MTLTEIYADYREYEGKYRAKEGKLERLIATHQRSLRKLEHSHKGWIDCVLIPLANLISEKLGGIYYDIYGPFGLSCETSVYFFPGCPLAEAKKKARSLDICKDETFGLTVTPKCRNGVCDDLYLAYDTGRRTSEYRKGSIGYLNGFNNIYEELPDSIEEIIGLLRHHPAKEE